MFFLESKPRVATSDLKCKSGLDWIQWIDEFDKRASKGKDVRLDFDGGSSLLERPSRIHRLSHQRRRFNAVRAESTSYNRCPDRGRW